MYQDLTLQNLTIWTQQLPNNLSNKTKQSTRSNQHRTLLDVDRKLGRVRLLLRRGSVYIAYRAGGSGADSGCGDSDSGCWLGLAVYSLAVNGAEKLRSQLILIAVGTALIAGNWDAWQAWIIANSQLLIFSFALIVITLGFVGAQIWSKLNNVSNRNQPIVAGLLGVSIAGIVALPPPI
jgi:hypothetical protein